MGDWVKKWTLNYLIITKRPLLVVNVKEMFSFYRCALMTFANGLPWITVIIMSVITCWWQLQAATLALKVKVRKS